MKLKKYSRLIVLILIFTIFINYMFYQEVQAEAIAAGLAIKTMAVILSSMGVLHVVLNNGGIQNFFDEFILFNPEGLVALRDMAIRNIVNNVKIKTNNVINSIKQFFNSWISENIEGDIFDIRPGIKATYTNTINKQMPYLISGSEEMPIIDDYVVYEDEFNLVTVKVTHRLSVMPSASASRNEFNYRLKINGTSIISEYVDISEYIPPKRFRGSNAMIKCQFQMNENYIVFNTGVRDYDNNLSYVDSIRYDFEEPLTIIQFPGYVDPTFDIPQPQSLPRNGIDIAWDEATNKSISYIPGETKLEELIEQIANASVDVFVEKYSSWGKATTDSLTGPIIRTETRVNQDTGVEEEVVIDVTETVFDDIYEETQTQTGLLGSILGALTDIKEFIKSIFIPEDYIAIDFSPIQNIELIDKFPFSIPWDLKKSVEKLSADAKPPRWEIPIVTEIITIDMAKFEHLANIMRIFNTLLFVVALIILTRRLI